MPTRPQIEITREELDRAEIPMNHVLVQITRHAEGLKTHAGIQIGFNEDVVYAEGDDSHSANLAEIFGIVTKVPDSLFFDPTDSKSLDWDTDMELGEGDLVWFSLVEAKNSVQVLCEGIIYKSVPYSDIYCYSREIWVDKWSDPPKKKIVKRTINGYVLCEPCFKAKTSDLDHFSSQQEDKTRGVIKFIGSPVNAFLRPEYSQIGDLQIGDEVLFDNKTPLFYLERLGYTGVFDNGKKYYVVHRRRIVAILNR